MPQIPRRDHSKVLKKHKSLQEVVAGSKLKFVNMDIKTFHFNQLLENTYILSDETVEALIVDPGEPGWLGPYIVQLKPDPWGTPYGYAVRDDGTPDVFTAGPDLKPGTPDDLRPDPESYDPGADWTNGWLKVEDRLPDIGKILSERDREE